MGRAGIGDRLEGLHAVAAAVTAGRVTKLRIESQRLRHDDYARLVRSVEEAGGSVEVVDDVRPFGQTEAPQGVVAEAEPIAPVTLDEAVGRTSPAALLVLDHMADPRNVGAAARSALAAGVEAIVVPERRAAPIGATAFKAAAGALETVAVVLVGSIPDALERLRRLDVWRLGLDGEANATLFGHHLLAEPVAVVIGGEGKGLARLTKDRCDDLARIPIDGRVESLNAAVAAALAVFEIARARTGA